MAAASAMPVVASLALVWLTTILLVVVTSFVPINLVALVYILPVVLAATQWGIAPGLSAAFASAVAADFFFYPPLFSFWLESRQDVVDLLLYLLVAVVTSNLAARLRTTADSSNRREREIAELHAFSQGLGTCLTGRDVIFAAQDYLSTALKCRNVIIGQTPDDDGPDADGTAVPEKVRREALKLMTGNVPGASTIVEPPAGKAWLIRIVAPEVRGCGAVAVELSSATGEGTGDIANHVEAVLDEAAVTLKHLKAKEALEQATINYRTEILRDALVGGVSNELRGPLAAILGSCSVLSDMPGILDNTDSHNLVEAIHDQAVQLDTQIRDMLDAARISAKGVRPQLAWTDPTDIVDAAIRQKKRRLATHDIVLDLRGDVPLVHVDTVLVEQALGQLLENAVKYSPAGTTITISSRCGAQYVELSVGDQGSGLTADEKRQLGKRCYRSERNSAVSGSGLGLWIASTFVAANGGSLHAESRGPELGATISLRLPTVSEDTPELVDTLND
ncbi:MAG: DUF4118 domain-containing protein [Xanthobacteraceae bacterium]